MVYSFGKYRIDTRLFELRRAGVPQSVEPQVFDILVYLLEHRDRVVTKDELFDQIWRDRVVSESTLNNRMMAVRRAVGDSGRDQRLIATLHGRGFRFIAPVTEARASPDDVTRLPRRVRAESADSSAPFRDELSADPVSTGEGGYLPVYRVPSYTAAPAALIGRDAELEALAAHLGRTGASARRSVVFVTGETGIGKTTLVEAFLDEVIRQEEIWLLHGHCVQLRGAGEPYMPVLEALGRLCRAPGGREVVALLARQAPTWLVQMPWLIDRDQLADLQLGIAGSTRDRMLREMVEVLESLAAVRPVVLFLEDLHWSDYSTLDLLARLARRPEPARVLIIGTYRPAEAVREGHPLLSLRSELGVHGLCEEMPLRLLHLSEVEAYLSARFPGADLPAELARVLHARTDGNPLFMGNILDFRIAGGMLTKTDEGSTFAWSMDEVAHGVPDSLKQLVEQQLALLAPEHQAVLEAAAVTGMAFEASAVAAAIEMADEDVEELCADMARHGRFLHSGGLASWNDGTVTSRFRFIHHLFREVLYDRVPAGRRSLYHRRIGLRLEAGFASDSPSNAQELGLHFEKAHDAERAVRYLLLSAEQALSRSAQREAIDHLSRASGLVQSVTDDADRMRLEVRIQALLGSAFVNLEGWSSIAAEEAFLRARALSEQLEGNPQLVPILYELALLYEFRGEFEASQELMERRLRLSEGSFLPEAHELLACSKFYQGNFGTSLDHARRGLTVYLAQESPRLPGFWGHDSGILCHDWAALALWFLGYADQAREEARLAVELAERTENQHSLSNVRMKTAILSQCLLDVDATAAWAVATVELATQQGFHYRVGLGMVLEGWASAARNGSQAALDRIEEGLRVHESTGAKMDRPYVLGLKADACLRSGRAEQGLAAVSQAQGMLRDDRPFFYESELHRLKGLLLMTVGAETPEVEHHLRRALGTAQRQHSRPLVLRAALALAGISEVGKNGAGAELIAPLYTLFTEGFDTADLVEARKWRPPNN